MGEIFLARQTGVAGFDRLVILKSLLPDLAEQTGLVDQFLDEARVAAMLNHPNIVSIYEVGEWGGLYFIAMEYIRGDNLSRLMQATITSRIRMPPLVPLRVVHDAALGLDHAHHAVDTDGKPLNIVHRDIGLQNIMVRADGVAKVVDFGIAHAANRSTRTRTGMVKGKLQYMSPEQVAGKDLDGRSDQFSLGIVLWELLTQRRLFKGDNEFLTMQKLLADPIPPPSSVVPAIPADVDAVVMRALQRDREERYPNCGDVAGDLAKVIERLRGTGATGQKVVATFVERALGDKLADATRDLTPSTETPFAAMMGLAGLQAGMSAQGPTTSEIPRHGARRLIATLALGLALVTALVGGAIYAGLVPSPLPGSTSLAPRLEVRAPTGATVTIDGKPWTQPTPTVVEGLTAGDHTLELALPNRAVMRRSVTLRANERLVISEQPPAAGMVLDVREPRGARVVVDGVRWPTLVPTVVTGLAAGPHQVRLELEDGRVVERQVRLSVGMPIVMQDTPPAQGMVLDIRDPEGATVMVDGSQWPRPVPTVVTGLAPGEHHVALKQPDKPAIQRRVALEIGMPVIISEPPVADGMVLDVRDPVGARVVIDGRPWPSVVPTVVTGLAAGEREVRLELPGRPAVVKRVTMTAETPVLLQVQAPGAWPTLVLKSKPAGAKVTVGGRAMGKTPTRLMTLEPELEHEIILDKRGYAPASLRLILRPGEVREENVALETSSGAKAMQPTVVVKTVYQEGVAKADGFLTLKTKPWVKVSVDGKPFGSTPLYKVELPPGPHTLHLVNEELRIDVKRNIVIHSGKPTKVDLTLQ